MLRYADLRFDGAAIKELPDGSIKVTGQLTHTGIFPYRNSDGSKRLEYRPADEVFSPEAMATFAGATVTVNHPSRLVDAKSWRTVTVGHLGENVRRDGDFLVADVYVREASAVARVKKGELKHLSCGYEVDFDPTPGVTAEGQRYDGIQRRIRGNHVALLPNGVPPRGGETCVLRLDSAGDEIPTGLNSDVTPEQIAALQAQVTALTAELAKARTDAATATSLQTQLDAAKAELAKANEQTSPARLDALVEERVAVLALAKANGVETKGKSNVEIKRAVVAKRTPALAARVDSFDAPALDGILAVYGDAAAAASQKAAVGVVTDAPTGERTDAARTDAAREDANRVPTESELRDRARKANADAWKSPGAFSRS